MRFFVGAGLVMLLSVADAAGQSCRGDFNGDRAVTVDEIVVSVNNALTGCPMTGSHFWDNGDGTITDTSTGLTWEKKSDDGGIHDWDDAYAWCADVSPSDFECDNPAKPADGAAFTVFLAALNAPPCFAGHCDWRLPSAHELEGLVNFESGNPAIDPAFHANCAAACTVATCGCTQSSFSRSSNYWTSTTFRLNPAGAWIVSFDTGYAGGDSKTTANYVRAVRGDP